MRVCLTELVCLEFGVVMGKLTRLFFCALLILKVAPIVGEAEAGAYSSPPYATAICTCTMPLCCVDPQSILREALTGTGNWTGRNLQDYYTDDLYPKIEQAYKEAADAARDAVISYAYFVGKMMDGQDLNSAMTTLQKQNTRAMQNYAVSGGLCRFGTMSRSLAQSEDRVQLTQLALMRQAQQRELIRANTNSGSAEGDGSSLGLVADKKGRYEVYRKKFCDKLDANMSLTKPNVCDTTSDTQVNSDIDFARTIENPMKLNIDFSNTSGSRPTADEENVIALMENLYAHNLMFNMGKSDFEAIKKNDEVKTASLFDFRALTAKRSVAENSFAVIAALKSAGGDESATYIKEVMKELGISDSDERDRLITDNPSYYTQMEVLTRKLYQSPRFYANLMESPENVARQQSSIKAISLMQDRDIYESLRRSEMLLSTLMEIYVLREQDALGSKGAN